MKHDHRDAERVLGLGEGAAVKDMTYDHGEPWPAVDPKRYENERYFGAEVRHWLSKPWEPAATRMFEEWRTQSPRICFLCWLRFMREADAAVKRLERKRATTIRIPYLSNGFPVHHYKRRVTKADFEARSQP